jgi:hypothetical protein
LACASLAAAAIATSYAGGDPSRNYPTPSMPGACASPTSARCVQAAVEYLDAARANLGEPAYRLPRNFTSLTPAEQGFVLANLDRLLYGLRPITGMTAALDRDAAGGVRRDQDPQPSDPDFNAWTANWAGGYVNLPEAYGAWMYDDGAGSSNLDCSARHRDGCWAHRHDVLWRFPGSARLAMGVAAGTDSDGMSGYAMILGAGGGSYRPVYTFTWAQAVAQGAGRTTASTRTGAAATAHATSAPARVRIRSLRVRGHRVWVRLRAPHPNSLRCALTRRRYGHWSAPRYRRCTTSTRFRRLRAGHYRLRVRDGAARPAARYLRVG